jgi:hypothetical protein
MELLTIVVALMTASASLHGSDPATTEIAAKEQLAESTRDYKVVTGSDPTVENLTRSLSLRDATGAKAAEILAALDILAVTEQDKNRLVTLAVDCLEHNRNNGDIAVKVCNVVLPVDQKKGVAIADGVLHGVQYSLEAKLHVARALLQVGNVSGYTILGAGLISSSPMERRVAKDVFVQFERFDGTVITGTDGKVDLHGLLSTLESRTADDDVKKELRLLKDELNRSEGEAGKASSQPAPLLRHRSPQLACGLEDR